MFAMSTRYPRERERKDGSNGVSLVALPSKYAGVLVKDTRSYPRSTARGSVSQRPEHEEGLCQTALLTLPYALRSWWMAGSRVYDMERTGLSGKL